MIYQAKPRHRCHFDSSPVFAIAISALFFVEPLYAQQNPQADQAAEQSSNFHFGLALGYGERSNPLVDGDDIDIYWLADIAWYGESWFFDNGDLGYTYFDNEHLTLNIIGSINSDRVFFSHLNDGFLGTELTSFVDDIPEPERETQSAVDDLPREQQAALIDSPSRDYAVELGLELLTDGPWGFLQAQFNSDISSVHNGHELWVKYGYDWYKSRWQVQPSISVSWKSAEFNNYYFGVRPGESTVFLPTYTAGSGVNYTVKLSVKYLINEHFSLVGTAEYEKLNSEASDSPFMYDDYITSFFAGVFYHF